MIDVIIVSRALLTAMRFVAFGTPSLQEDNEGT